MITIEVLNNRQIFKFPDIVIELNTDYKLATVYKPGTVMRLGSFIYTNMTVTEFIDEIKKMGI